MNERAAGRRIGAIGLVVVAWLSLAASAGAQLVGWLDEDGNPVPDSDSMKSREGFGGWLLVTGDPDWEAKWNTPSEETPHFNETDSVRVGETVVALIFISSPAADADGNVDVSCDLRLDRPDGSHSFEQPDAPCMVGHLEGASPTLYLAEPVMGFLGEASDPVGEWTFHVRLKDRVRGTILELKSPFTFSHEG